MTIENIISFVNVYRCDGFRRAAEAMYLTQPTLSSRIKALERELGAELFERTRKGTALTPAGEAFLPYALQIVNSYTQAMRALSSDHERLVIGTNISISIAMLPHVFRELHRKHPSLAVEILTNLPGQLLELLRNHECDFLITQCYGLEELTEIPVYSDKISLIVPAGHPLASHPVPPDYSEVALEPIICSSAMLNYWEKIEKHFRSRGLAPNVVLSVDSVEVAKNLVMQGLGVAFLPELALEKELMEGTLIALDPLPHLSVTREIGMIFLSGEEPPYCREFIEACRRYRSWSERKAQADLP